MMVKTVSLASMDFALLELTFLWVISDTVHLMDRCTAEVRRSFKYVSLLQKIIWLFFLTSVITEDSTPAPGVYM